MNAHSDQNIEDLVQRFCREIDVLARQQEWEVAQNFIRCAAQEWRTWNQPSEQAQSLRNSDPPRPVPARVSTWLGWRLWLRRSAPQEPPSDMIIDVPSSTPLTDASKQSQTVTRLRELVANALRSGLARIALLFCLLILASVGGIALRSSDLWTSIAVRVEDEIVVVEEMFGAVGTARDVASDSGLSQWPVWVPSIAREGGEAQLSIDHGSNADGPSASSQSDRAASRGDTSPDALDCLDERLSRK
jgi:hypothetical protein